MKTKIFYLLIFLLPVNLFANNIKVTYVTLENKNTTDNYISVIFNLSWENSWRISSAPSNWDAAWVFVKYRENGGAWNHAVLSSNDIHHNTPSGCTIDASSDGMGVFIYRNTNGSGTNNWTDIDLRWLYGNNDISDDATNIEIKVFAIEMVYVPEGQFYVGDGSSVGRFWNANDINTNPALISSTPITLKCEDPNPNQPPMDEQLEGDGILIDGNAGIDVDGTTAIDNSNFPTGYNAFYCMKYEITNQQFADFLNTLTFEQQNTRTYFDLTLTPLRPYPMNRVQKPQNRSCVRSEFVADGKPIHFFCDLNENGIANDADDGKNITMCNIMWQDAAAFADWSGLRPMTELEFEKACRGPEIPVAGEFAWGTTNIYGDGSTVFDINNLGAENSYPVVLGTGIHANAQYQYTTGHDTQHDAPLRVGMFATATSNRINAGASYYGIMELSGGLSERAVTIANIIGRNFQGTHGNGTLTTIFGHEGNADNADWPGYVTGEETHGIKSHEGSGYKGGDWNDGLGYLTVSNRFLAARDIYAPNAIGAGFRAVRTAE